MNQTIVMTIEPYGTVTIPTCALTAAISRYLPNSRARLADIAFERETGIDPEEDTIPVSYADTYLKYSILDFSSLLIILADFDDLAIPS